MRPEELATLALCFMVGAIPFGIIATQSKGIDLKKIGSGNIGATNVLRAAGAGAAIFTLTGDILKGTAAVAIAKYTGGDIFFQGICGLAAILGHDFSPIMKFKGGKGVATSIGVLLLYTPAAGLLTVCTWIGIVALFRYSSLGAVVAFLTMPAYVYFFGYPVTALTFAAIISSVLLIKHRENIRRLLNGNESKIGNKA